MRDRQVTIAYGARCTWWNDKAKVSQKPSGLPCCPYCGGVLFECEMEKWWADAHRFEAEGHPDYVPFLRWLQGRCFADHDMARAAYEDDQDVEATMADIDRRLRGNDE